MSHSDAEPAGAPREVEVTMSDETKIKGDIINDGKGGFAMKLPGSKLADRQEVVEAALAEETEADGKLTPVTVFVQITDKVLKQLSQEGRFLLEEGEPLLAWMRVKVGDKKFVTKTTLFSLGAVAAISITRRTIQHYKSR